MCIDVSATGADTNAGAGVYTTTLSSEELLISNVQILMVKLVLLIWRYLILQKERNIVSFSN